MKPTPRKRRERNDDLSEEDKGMPPSKRTKISRKKRLKSDVNNEDQKWIQLENTLEEFVKNSSTDLTTEKLQKEAEILANQLKIQNTQRADSWVSDILEQAKINVEIKDANSTKKRPTPMRRSYTASKKLEIIKFAEQNGGNRAASREFGIPEGCVRKWRTKKGKLECANGNKLSFREGRKAFNREMEEQLVKHVKKLGIDNPEVSKKTICLEATRIAEKLRCPDFKASPSWYAAFLQRNHLAVPNRMKVKKRDSYTASFKLEAVEFAEKNGGSRAAGRKYGISEANIRNWTKMKSKLENAIGSKRAFRGNKEYWPELEEKLANWILQYPQSDIEKMSISDVILKAKKFAQDMNISKFTGSVSWYNKFLRRKNLKGVLKRQEFARASYTTDFKLEVVKFADENGIKKTEEKFGVHVTCIRKWQKNRDILKKFGGNAKSTRSIFNGKYSILEDCLAKYALEHETDCCGVTEHQLRSKACFIAVNMNLEKFRNSDAWFAGFKRRKNIKLSTENTDGNEGGDVIIPNSTNSYVCGICCKSFEKQYHFRLHIALHIEGTENLCHVCGKTYSQK